MIENLQPEEIRIYGKAVFDIEINHKMVDILIKCAERHYDGKCKAAGREDGRFGTWRKLLLLTDAQHQLMKAQLELAGQLVLPPEPYRVDVTWEELDNTCKVLEAYDTLDITEEGVQALSMRIRFCGAMNQARDVGANWETSWPPRS